MVSADGIYPHPNQIQALVWTSLYRACAVTRSNSVVNMASTVVDQTSVFRAYSTLLRNRTRQRNARKERLHRDGKHASG